MNKQLDIEAIRSSKTYKELEKHVTLTEVIQALNQRETQRLAHKRYTQKRQLVLEKAMKLKEERPELFE